MPIKLIPVDLFIFNRILFFTEKKQGFCFETNRSISEIVGRSIPRVSCSISKLIKHGFVINEGTLFNRRLRTTDKRPKINLNLNDMTTNLNDKSFNAKTISETITDLYLNDKATLTKTIRDLNLNDNIVRDLVKELSKRISKEEVKGNILPSDFKLEDRTKILISEKGYPETQVDRALFTFVDYWSNGNGKNKVKKNWQSTFLNWIYGQTPKTWEKENSKPKSKPITSDVFEEGYGDGE